MIEWHEGVAIEHQVKMGYLKRVRAYREFVVARTKRIAMERVVWGLEDRGKGAVDDIPTQINFKMYLNYLFTPTIISN